MFHTTKFTAPLLTASVKKSLIFDLSLLNVPRWGVVIRVPSVRNVRAELNISYKNNIDLILDLKDKNFVKFVKNFNDELTRFHYM